MKIAPLHLRPVASAASSRTMALVISVNRPVFTAAGMAELAEVYFASTSQPPMQ